MIADNTRRLAGGSAPSVRYADLIKPKQPEENKTVEEKIDEINKKCGLIMIDDTLEEGGIDEC